MEEEILDEDEIKTFNTEIVDKDKRLDNYLLEKFGETYSRSKIKNMIDDGLVSLNGKTKLKAGEKLKANDEIIVTIPYAVPVDISPENIPLDIVYEDDDFAIINKKQGMVVHPAVGNQTGTLVNALLYHFKSLSGINGENRAGIVHRIDKDTSGLLVVAKNDIAHRVLSEEIATKTCKRIYRAICYGNFSDSEGVISTYIGRSPKDRKKMAVVDNGKGKLAITHYRVLEKLGSYSYVEFELKTGRTHQIRVHSAYMNHAIVGDMTYAQTSKNKFKLKGQLLHAYKLILKHPKTNKEMTFTCPLPDYFEKVLSILRNGN